MITVSYSGVHQAYQLALAAQEARLLHEFHCSLYDAPGKWGGLLSRIAGPEKLRSRRLAGLDPTLIREHPWPLLAKVLRDRFNSASREDWLQANNAFDRWSASQFAARPAEAVFATETCALHLFNAARRSNATTILDCPQHHPDFLHRLLSEAADRTSLPPPSALKGSPMLERTRREYDLADWRFTFSPQHSLGFEQAGFPKDRQIEIPLWVDTNFWHPSLLEEKSEIRNPKSEIHRPLNPQSAIRTPHSPLRLLFAGSITLRKGIPFLLDAVRQSGVDYHLTLAGPVDPLMQPLLLQSDPRIRILPPQSKSDLRALYQSHDLFILPSVADSFGFVALEAMACGLPALVSENCGAPVPSPDWRVRAMDPQHLAERIAWFASQRDLWPSHSIAAAAFAAGFTPARYRNQVARFLTSHLPPS
jgi:glycosyltransferase involved in cell wall biosynthesis